ncbi:MULTISPECIES: putative bifunctional diguanylate cyclase/phosphodiesterase [unclassified Sphingobium]|uniref:putative bifunctional diguanylate cyclase/phosphodiesterase n=1 Tax=unclassified Sphingobium TaxID=2611147 RepID=UPI00119A503C|nr:MULTISPECIES: GGDEF domain-containing phosphodiesterase [unclassified Sphingobium]MBG6120546.1 PAS domain S-box-containing protein [Sphingobium sp. JAI105]TWD00616.1 PAS domain S-box-containing protein [Sphingobium sp. AEW010]TWD19697.1 PAS domain S-box-containing protein [Sphingobium sp. AEW013]TWD22282.1 PAS domain S-box-containing protein [Sphingobium sp. AEW001]
MFKPARWHRLVGQSTETAVPGDAGSLILDHVSDGVLIADMRLRGHPIVQVNPAFETITGYSAAEVIDKNCRYLQGNDRLQPEIAEIRAALAEGRSCAVTLRNYRRDGAMFRNALRLEPLRDDEGNLTHFLGLIRDVTHAAGIDRLTGLLDRYALLDRLAQLELSTGCVLLVIKLDILRFHDVNNGFGYDVGDALLCAVAARLATLPAAAISRADSNNFALAFELDDASRAAGIVDGVLDLLRPRFILPGTSLAVQFAAGFTIGLACSEPLQLVRQAGAALQRSKATPGHSPYPFAASDERDARNRIRLANELQTAVSNEELLFHYQPQVDLGSGVLVGAEALLRWNHGAFGLQPPARFIGVAEETGAMMEIGAWGLRTIAAYAARVNQRRDTPVRFAFNVSVIEFLRRDMAAFVEQQLEETGCQAQWLTLELTENLMIPEPDDMRRSFEQLRRLGVNISVDDFGTGYSNLRYLERFPLSEIKIDRSFVRDVAHSEAKRVIVESVVKLGAALDIHVVAEGIETEAERTIVQALGCSVGQGYLFAPPVVESQFEQLLHDGFRLCGGWSSSGDKNR